MVCLVVWLLNYEQCYYPLIVCESYIESYNTQQSIAKGMEWKQQATYNVEREGDL